MAEEHINYIILASKSPRRRTLLEHIIPRDRIIVKESNIREKRKKGEGAEAFCMRVAREKAESVWKLYRSKRDDIIAVIGADTAILCGGEVIGQPSDRADAARILKKLSGRHHKVMTGVAVLFPRLDRSETFIVTSKVWMHRLDDRMIADYIATNEPLDKAGAYAIQGTGGSLIAAYEGSFTNIIGLPVEELKRVLGAVLE